MSAARFSATAPHPAGHEAAEQPERDGGIAVAYRGNLGEIERLAAEATGADLIDFTGRVCRGDPCPGVVDGMIVFRDTRHITATFSRSMAPDLDGILARIIEVDHLQPPPVGTGT